MRGRSPSRPKPHSSPDDAFSGADCVRVKFKFRYGEYKADVNLKITRCKAQSRCKRVNFAISDKFTSENKFYKLQRNFTKSP